MLHMGSAFRVASRYVQARKITAASAFPVPLTSEQKDFLKDLATSLNAVLRQHVDGSKPDYSAATDYQTGKPYKRDGFGRNSILAGVPHARIYLSITVAKGDRMWSGNLPAFEFLLSADGTTAIVKNDNPWGRGNKPMTSLEIGTAWAKSIVWALDRALQLDQRALEKRRQEETEEERRREEEERRREEEERRREEEARKREEEARKREEEARKRAEEEARKRKEEEARKRREFPLTGDGKGYALRTIIEAQDDELDVDDDPWERPDPKIRTIREDTLQLASMSEVYRNLGSYDMVHVNSKDAYLIFSRDYTRRYNARGMYGLTRFYDEQVLLKRVDGKPFNDAEKEYIKVNLLPKASRVE